MIRPGLARVCYNFLNIITLPFNVISLTLYGIWLSIVKQCMCTAIYPLKKFTNHGRNLGVFIHSDFSFGTHIYTVTKSAYHFKNTSRIKGLMSQQDLEKWVHANIFSRLDQCFSTLFDPRCLIWLKKTKKNLRGTTLPKMEEKKKETVDYIKSFSEKCPAQTLAENLYFVF